MPENLINEYNKLTSEIQEEKNSGFRELISGLVKRNCSVKTEKESGEIEKAGADSNNTMNEAVLEPAAEAERGHRIALLSLQALRIAANCKLIRAGCCDRQKELRQDIADAVENVRFIEYSRKADDNIVLDTLELLTFICPSGEEIIKENLKYVFASNKKKRLNHRRIFTLKQFLLFYNVACYYKNTGRTALVYSILDKLADISRERGNAKLHREIVVEIITLLEDKAPEITCKICNSDLDRFEGIADDYSGDFFWFYACALEQNGDTAAATKFYEICYNCRKRIYGENTWFTDIAKRETVRISYAASKSEEDRAYLLKFIDNIENGLYDDDIDDKELLTVIAGRTLYIVLSDCSDIDDFKQFDRYLKQYEKICERYDNRFEEPLLKIRLAKNLRAAHYMKSNDYLQAEAFFTEALNAHLPNGTLEILTEAQIKSNLLMIYSNENDFDKAVPLLNELLDLFDDKNAGTDLSEKDKLRVCIIACGMITQVYGELDSEDAATVKSFLEDACNDLFVNGEENAECAREIAVFLTAFTTVLLQNENITKEEQEHYLKILLKIENDMEKFWFDKTQTALLYHIISLMFWNLGRGEAEHYVRKSLFAAEDNNVPKTMRISILQTAAAYYGKHGSYCEGSKCLKKTLNELTGLWQTYVRCLNDVRLLQILSTAQLSFSYCYDIMRDNADTEYVYENLLRFKVLASLAGRERNRIIHGGNVDKQLLNSVRALQDKIALLETTNIYRDNALEYEKEIADLRQTEAEFARYFPESIGFTDITFEKVKEAIPRDSAVIEYFLCRTDYGRMQFEIHDDNSDEITAFDIYIIRKIDGSCTLQRLTMPYGYLILKNAYEFVEILQAQSNNEATAAQTEKLDDIRSMLYGSLIKPLLPYIEGVKTLYIAPDDELINLPFEILYDENEERTDDKYNLIKIECARDFLYNDKGNPPRKGNLIIGNPKYKVDEPELGKTDADSSESGSNRKANVRADAIRQLPFSEVEARKVCKRCGGSCFIGSKASKNLLLAAEGYENIHISTHGNFDLTDETQAVYSSCLLFAGVRNWLETGRISEFYGNGVVTADEISRMNLHGVKLTVLSSCLNGMNEVVSDKGFHGMIGALSAAGVQYVISNLWSANDFGTAILMDEFYYQYIEKEQSPPVALKSAKRYLRDITVRELKEKGWFDYAKQAQINKEDMKKILEWEKRRGEVKPFKNEIYWGGFTCYRCN